MEDERGLLSSAYDSQTFEVDMSIRVDLPVGSMSISPCGRDVVLASQQGLHIIDLDNPYSPPRHLPHHTPWEVADVQWSPFPIRDYWVISTSNQKAIVWNLAVSQIDHVLHAHSRAITDINFSMFHPDIVATCAVDSFVHCWDLRNSRRPSISFSEWFAGATQVKWSRQDSHIIASSHDKYLRIWDDRKGAYPLRSIDAHDTKIYGIDWNRTDANRIVTCSLDQTVKFWDYSNLEDKPERILQASFPIWRARHTPFGRGLLVMPQRGDNDLYLYDRANFGEDNQIARPVWKFKNHTDQVKEFLWRSRGSDENGTDEREFQLVSWGKDRHLRLHRISEKIINDVGFVKGGKTMPNLHLTRRNATYKTFHDDIPRHNSNTLPANGMSLLMGDAARSDNRPRGAIAAMMKAPSHWSQGGFTAPISARYGRQVSRKEINPISWMKGVKIGKKRVDGPPKTPVTPSKRSTIASPRTPSSTWDAPESLGDEITSVGDKYKRVKFMDIDMASRIATVSMNGPWGAESKPIFLKARFSFPTEYPEAELKVDFEKTSAMADATYAKMVRELKQIAKTYVSRRRGSLEATLSYLLGEKDLEDSTAWLLEEERLAREAEGGESSSDEEGNNGAISLEESRIDEGGSSLIAKMNRNLNLPLPKLCGAMWSDTGKLICFFPPKNAVDQPFNKSIASAEPGLAEPIRFDNFVHSNANSNFKEADNNGEDDYSSDSFTSSSESDSDSAQSVGNDTGWYSQPARKRPKAQSRNSERSGNAAFLFNIPARDQPKNVIALHDYSQMLPSKKRLAEEYAIYGDGPMVCEHNANVATKHGEKDLAAIWTLAKLLLMNQVPLEIMSQSNTKEHILVIAHRTVKTNNRRDSGFELGTEDLDSRHSLYGRVKWGRHPFGGRWLVGALFDHFERLADIQMLGMLACVFSEPAANEGVAKTMIQMTLHDMPLSMKSPAFSLDYYSNRDQAISLQPSGIFPFRNKMSNLLRTHGSAGSSNGLWGSDPVTPYSTGATPPMLVQSLDVSDPSSLSGSPENRHIRRSTSMSTATFSSSVPRALSSVLGTSPGTKRRLSPAENVFSSIASGAVTWGTNRIYYGSRPKIDSASEIVHNESFEDDEVAIEEEKGELRGGQSEPTIFFNLRNQDQFDDEGSMTVPLLDPKQSLRYRAYRATYADMLYMWDLQLQRLEVLKFNGLQAFYEDEEHQILDPLDKDGEAQHEWNDFVFAIGRKKTISRDSVAEEDDDGEWAGLEVLKACHTCNRHYTTRSGSRDTSTLLGESMETIAPAGRRCSTCTSALQTKLRCAVCLELIHGTYAPCLKCGHVTHSRCHIAWFEGENAICPTGCDCECQFAALNAISTLDEE